MNLADQLSLSNVFLVSILYHSLVHYFIVDRTVETERLSRYPLLLASKRRAFIPVQALWAHFLQNQALGQRSSLMLFLLLMGSVSLQLWACTSFIIEEYPMLRNSATPSDPRYMLSTICISQIRCRCWRVLDGAPNHTQVSEAVWHQMKLVLPLCHKGMMIRWRIQILKQFWMINISKRWVPVVIWTLWDRVILQWCLI